MKMPRPFGRRRAADRPGFDSAIESALRHSLASNAMDAPPADDLAQRILAAVDSSDPVGAAHRVAGTTERAPGGPAPSRSPWLKNAGLPLVAAAVVAAIVAIGVGIAAYNPDHDGTNRAATDQPSASATQAVQTPTTSPTTSVPTTTQPTGTSGLTEVEVADLTFFGGDNGVALASAKCLTGPGRCVALLKTTDGKSWKPFGGNLGFDVPGVRAGCPATRCVQHIRFANENDGYAYGPDAFFTTTDGGANWTRQSGGAVAVESLGGNVIRVRTTSPVGGCPPGCSFEVQRTSGVSTNDWSTVALPGGGPLGDGVQLSRGGVNNQYAYLLVTQNPAGGGSPETSTLYASYDDGKSWADLGEPCPQSGGEVDSYQISAGVDGDVTALCRSRDTGPYRVAVSTDAGKHFSLRAGEVGASEVAALDYTDGGGALPTVLAGDPTTALAVAGRGVSVSTDGGQSWQQSSDLTGAFGFVGFQSTKTARAVNSDGSEIWTTHNAGRTWHRSRP